MAGRNRLPPHAMKGGEPPFPRGGHGLGLGPIPAHHFLEDELRDRDREVREREGPFGRGGPVPRGPMPPHPAIIEERLAAQHQEIQGLLVDNQRLAATHVALKQELAAVQQELQRMAHAAGNMQADKEMRLRDVYENSMKMEAELRQVEAMKAELIQVRGDIQKLNAVRQELTGQVQMLTQDLTRATADVQQAPAIKAEIDMMKQELQRARSAIEYEKKGYAENYEQGQVMDKNLISMAREVEKLRAEVANAEKRARAVAAAGNQAAGYGATYGNADPSFGANTYPAGYGMNPVPGGADAAVQYGTGSAPGHGSWGAYDMQRAHQRR